MTAKVGKRHSADGFVVDNKEIIGRGGIIRQLEADSLVDAAADLVAADGGFEDFFRDNNANSAHVAGVGHMN